MPSLLHLFPALVLAAGIAQAAETPKAPAPATPASAAARGPATFTLGGARITCADSDYLVASRTFILRGNVRIVHDRAVITCDTASIDTTTFNFTAKGHVIVSGTSNGTEIRTDMVSGNIQTRLIQIGSMDLRSRQFYFLGDAAQSETDQTITAENVTITTCDHIVAHKDCPDCQAHYRIVAEKLVITEDGDVTAHGARFYIGDTQYLYLPWFITDMGISDGGFAMEPGYDSKHGAFLKIGYRFRLHKGRKGTPTENELIELTPRFDLYAENGLALGLDFKVQFDKSNTSGLLYYVPSDSSAGDDGFIGRFDEPSERYNYSLKHRTQITKRLTGRLDLDYSSDIRFKEDYFNGNSDNILEHSLNQADLDYLTPSYDLSLAVRPRLNDYESVVEALPELRYDLPNYQVGPRGLFYSNYNSLGYYRARWRKFDQPLPVDPLTQAPLSNELDDYKAGRFDSLHALHFQTHPLPWLNFTPRMALRITHYTESSDTKVDSTQLNNLIAANDPYTNPRFFVSNYDDDGGSVTRVLGELGYELSFKSYRTWYDAHSDFWQVDGLRHVMRPYINHNFIPFSTANRDKLYYFDETDRIAKQHWVRTGVENRFQTRRNGKIHTLLTVDNYVDFHIDQPEKDHQGLGDFGTHVEFRPWNTFSATSDTIIDPEQLDINLFSLTTRIGDPNLLQWSIGYLYRADHRSYDVFSNASTLHNPTLYSPFSRTWTEGHTLSASVRAMINVDNFIETGLRYDVLNAEIYSKYIEWQRRLHCWTMALRLEDTNYDWRVMILFYLNAQPGLSLGLNQGSGGGED